MAKKKKKVNHNNEKSTRENTSMEQPYLMPVASNYDEDNDNDIDNFVMHDPFRPNGNRCDDVKDNNKHDKKTLSKAVDAVVPVVSHAHTVSHICQGDIAGFGNYNTVAMTAGVIDNAIAAIDGTPAERLMPSNLDNIAYADADSDDMLPKTLSKYL